MDLRSDKMAALHMDMTSRDMNMSSGNYSHLDNGMSQESQGYFDKCVYQSYKVTVPFVFALVVLLGIMGNVLVIYVILSRKKLRTVTNLLLANLAIADVSFLLICGTFTTVHYALEEWPLSDILCRIIQFLLYTTCYVTVYTLIAVSAVRFIIVIYGTNYKFIRSKRNIVILILAIWVVFLFAKVPILIVHGVSFDPLTNRTECIISGRTEGQQLFATFFVFAYALPLTVIATLYLLIVCHLKRKQHQALNQEGLSTRHMGHVTKVVILVVAVFAFCWLPLHIHLLVGYYGKIPHNTTYSMVLIVFHCLAFANSILNPVIYNIFSKDFREAFRSLFCCKRPNSRPCTEL